MYIKYTKTFVICHAQKEEHRRSPMAATAVVEILFSFNYIGLANVATCHGPVVQNVLAL